MRIHVATFALTAFGASALTAVPSLAQTAGAAAPVKEKKVCRRQDVTGSILGSKAVCHTKAEWAQIDRQNEEGADRQIDRDRQLQNSGASNMRSGG